jgi:hypothetical protein
MLTGTSRARAEEGQVRAMFARYGEWAGLAASYVLAARAERLPVRASRRVGAGRL